MPVDTRHPDYLEAAPKWKLMRDVLEGETAVKAAGEEYLPRLSSPDGTPLGERDRQYRGYKDRAQFFNATARTHQSLQGFIFRKNPTVTVPDSLAEFMRDSSLDGLSFYDISKDTVREVLGVGRRGTMIDFSEAHRRPFLRPYAAEDIWNWKLERVDGEMVIGLLTLHELDSEFFDLGPRRSGAQGGPTRPNPLSDARPPQDVLDGTAAPITEGSAQPDEFDQQLFEQWRVYRLETDEAGARFVRVTVYRRRDPDERGAGAEFVPISDYFPTRRGLALDRIPFVFHGPNHSLPAIDRIPLEDMALVNLSLYRTSADLENGRHICGIPTPWAAGFIEEVEEPPQERDADGSPIPNPQRRPPQLLLGSSVAWSSPNPEAKCGFLEFEGTGLGSLEKAVEQKKSEMAALGARMLEPEAKKAEAFETVAVRAAAETSALMNATVSCTQSLSALLRWAAWWLGSDEAPSVLVDKVATELNTEFTITSLPPEMITALSGLLAQSQISWEAFHAKMVQGEVFPPDSDAKKMRAEIEANPPILPPMPEPPPEPGA